MSEPSPKQTARIVKTDEHVTFSGPMKVDRLSLSPESREMLAKARERQERIEAARSGPVVVFHGSTTDATLTPNQLRRVAALLVTFAEEQSDAERFVETSNGQ